VTEVVMSVAIMGGFIVASVSFLLMTPFAKKNDQLQNVGIQLHLLCNLPDVTATSKAISASSTRMATKSETQLAATIKDLDAYDKRRLVLFSKFLDTEFAPAKADADAPQPMRRIKSTRSMEGAELDAGLGEEEGKLAVITV